MSENELLLENLDLKSQIKSLKEENRQIKDHMDYFRASVAKFEKEDIMMRNNHLAVENAKLKEEIVHKNSSIASLQHYLSLVLEELKTMRKLTKEEQTVAREWLEMQESKED